MSIVTYLYGISIWICEMLDAAFGRADPDMQQYPLGRKRLRITGINQQHAVSHMEKMHQFFMQGMHCDIDIIVGKRRYPVHRTILLTASEYFRKRLDKNTNELVLKKCEGIRDETVEQTIQFLYLGKMELMMHQVANIIKFSEILQLPELKKFCLLYMEKCISKTDPSLAVIKRIHDFMLENFTKVMAHEQFLNMSVNKVKALLQSEDLKISSEKEAFKGLTLWLRKDWNNRKQHIYALMKCIRLHLCPLSFLLSEVMALYCECFNECHLLFDAVQWHQNPEMRSNLTYLNKKARKLIEPKVLIVGDHDRSNPGLIEMYNPTWKTWSEFHDMGIKTTYSSYVILEERLLIFGGKNSDVTNEVKCLNLITKELTDLKPMQQKRFIATAEIVDGQVFVMGGFNYQEHRLNTVEQWNPITNTWTFMSPMISKRYHHASVVYNNEIFVFGGDSGSGYLQTAEAYSPNTNTWRSICPMSEKRRAFAAVVLKDHIYVLGGLNGFNRINVVERYDPENNTWSRMSNLPEAIFAHSAVVFNDRIICFGDYSTSSVFEYNPDTDQWTRIGEMPNKRYNYKALLTPVLPNYFHVTAP